MSSSEYSDSDVSDSESISSEELALAESLKREKSAGGSQGAAVPKQRIFIPLLREKLADFALNLPFSATLSVSAPALLEGSESAHDNDRDFFRNRHLENDSIRGLLPAKAAVATKSRAAAKKASTETAGHKPVDAVVLPVAQIHDDLARETAIYKSVLNAVVVTLPELKALGVPTTRPDDYYAEMLKSDAHMLRIKERILGEKKSIDEAEQRRQVREGKKFGKEVQKEREKEKREHRKKGMQNAQEWRKAGKDQGQLDKLLQDDNEDYGADYSSFSTTSFGGNKKRKPGSGDSGPPRRRGGFDGPRRGGAEGSRRGGFEGKRGGGFEGRRGAPESRKRDRPVSGPKQRPGKRARSMGRGGRGGK
eukprot:ANDGO_00762.mRNA.1 putative rRNA-processing protein EBP2 homolog